MKRVAFLLVWAGFFVVRSTVCAGVDATYEVLGRFYRTPAASSASLVLGPDGKYWGTARGGTFGSGAIYKVDDEGVVTTVVEFTGLTGPRRGSQPEATLLLASDGNYYGTTLRGGTHNAGTIYKLTPAGVLTTLVDFTGDTGVAIGHANTGPLAEGSDGNLYGTCTLTTGDGLGGIFRVTSDGAYTLLASFTGLAGPVPGRTPSNPSSPSGGMVTGTDGQLYGTTNSGGSRGVGTFFRVTTDGMVTVLYHFEDHPGVSGRSPLLRGADGNFYGSTSGRVLYRITPAGLFTKLVPSLNPNGFGDEVPRGPLIADGQGGFLGVSYTVPKGGNPSRPFLEGRIFRYSIAGGVSFLSSYWSDPHPPEIEGEPISGLFRTPTGEFIGAIKYIRSGTHTTLTRFRTTPKASNSLFTDLSDDVNPYARALRDDGLPYSDLSGPVIGSDGNLYGVYTSGAVYRVLPSGTIIHHAALPRTDAGASRSFVGRLLASHAGALYGIAGSFFYDHYDQLANQWVREETPAAIFRIALDGTVSKIHTFPLPSANFDPTIPNQPGDGLIEDAAGNLYGTTNGGAAGAGTIFRLATDGTFTTLAEFPGGKAGGNPGLLMLASDGNIYGIAGGGSKGLIVFRVTPSGDLATVCDLPALVSANESVWIPQRLVEGPDGHFYGITGNGGKSGTYAGYVATFGTLFRATKTGQFTTLVNFSGNGAAQRGAFPNNLILGLDGALYGTCIGGGVTVPGSGDSVLADGTLFRYTLDGLLSSVVEFGNNYPDTPGRSPLPGLVVDQAGAIYGAMAYNGASIFKVMPGSGGEAAVVAVKGGAVPGEPDGTRYAAFGSVTGGPFSGTLEFQRKKTAAVFGSDGRVLLRIGGGAPGLDGTQITKLGVPNGDAVLATLKSGPGAATVKNDTMLLAGLSAGPLRVAVREGSDLDGLPGVSVKTFGIFDGQGGAIFFRATLQGAGVTAQSDNALCAALGDGRVRVLVRERQLVEGRTVSIISTLVGLKGTLAEGRWRAASEAIGVRLTFSDKSQALYTIPATAAGPEAWTRWIGTGDTLEAAPLTDAKVSTLGFPGFGPDGPAFAATLAPLPDSVTKANDSVLFQADADGLLLHAREGEIATDSTGSTTSPLIELWKAFGDPVSGRDGRFAFVGKIASLPGHDFGLWYANDGTTLRRTAQKGFTAVGGGTWNSFVSLALPDGPGSGPIFTAKLAVSKTDGVTSKDALGLWAIDSAGKLRRLLRAGEQMLVGGQPRKVKTFTALTGSPGSLGAASGHDAGHVTVLATFTDKTQAIVRLLIP